MAGRDGPRALVALAAAAAVAGAVGGTHIGHPGGSTLVLYDENGGVRGPSPLRRP
eukprot:gene3940-4306_t